ncbi:MAG TPA: PEP-CTERM sorting domain-containing protein [Bryobacteraceae bacterium]|nr:PEP-CTERM sorting domain-containing protein [Bryobacteraceae bacterium]
MTFLAARQARLVMLAMFYAMTAPATIITGELHITGSVRIGADFADFIPLGGATGDFNVEPTSTGSFVALVDPGPSDDGDILDLNAGNAPVNVLFSLPNFLTFDLDPTVTFELEFVEPGAFSPCPVGLPVACSINQFNLVQTGSSVVANFNVLGEVHSGADVSSFTGSFSHVFTSRTIASLLTQIGTNGFIDTPFDGDFVVTPEIPEPSTIAMLGIGLGFLCIASVRRKRR